MGLGSYTQEEMEALIADIRQEHADKLWQSRWRRSQDVPRKTDFSVPMSMLEMLADEVIRECRQCYVYQVRRGQQVVYVGAGTGDRWLVSARRHDGIAGIVEYFRTATEAAEAEKQMIARLKPVNNCIVGGGSIGNRRDRRERKT